MYKMQKNIEDTKNIKHKLQIFCRNVEFVMVLEYLIAEINSDCRNYNYEKSFPPVTLKVEDQLYKITVACGL